MKASKRFFTALVAAIMTFASVSAVSAAETGDASTGSGAAEGYVNKDLLRVELPTTALDFVLDPQGLIKDSGSATTKYKGFTLSNQNKDKTDRTNGFVYFKTEVSNGKTTVKTLANSVDLTVENLGSANATIKPTLTYTDGKVNNKAMGCVGEVNKGLDYGDKPVTLGKNNVRFNLYMKDRVVTPASEGVEAVIEPYTLITDKNAMQKLLEGISQYYKVQYSANDGYTYVLDTSNTGYNVANKNLDKSKNTVTYTLEGISNPEATNWDAVTTAMNNNAEGTTVVQPEVKITWAVTKS